MAGDNASALAHENDTELELALEDVVLDTTGRGSGSSALEPTHSDDVIGNTTTALLEPPTPALAVFDPFVKWLLSAPMEEITSIHTTLPFELTASFAATTIGKAELRTATFPSEAHAQLARAEVEAQCEDVADLLSMARRERGGIEETVQDLQDERDDSRERIALLESRIVKHLQDRDLAIAEKYTTEKQIVELEAWKAQHPEKRHSTLLGFLKKTEKRHPAAVFTNKDIEKLHKEIADTKMETAMAKTELDTHYYRLRQLEKKCVGVKLEIAQASALEDDLQASLSQLRKERRSSLDKLQQVSAFSANQASPRGKKSPRKIKSPASPRRVTWLQSTI